MCEVFSYVSYASGPYILIINCGYNLLTCTTLLSFSSPVKSWTRLSGRCLRYEAVWAAADSLSDLHTLPFQHTHSYI